MTDSLTNLKGQHSQRVASALLEIQKNEPDFNANSFLAFFEKHKYFTPKQCAFITSRLKQYNIDHDPRDFTLSLRLTKYKEQLAGLPFSVVKAMWGYLKPSQQHYYNENIARFPIK